MIVITGATGHLGRLVIASLLERIPASQVVAVACNPSNAADLAALGVVVHAPDYGKPATLAGATSVLLICSPSSPGTRVAPGHVDPAQDLAASEASWVIS